MDSIRKSFTAFERAVVWDMTKGKCAYCGKQMHPFRDFSIDHVIPVYAGGEHHLDKLQAVLSQMQLIKADTECTQIYEARSSIRRFGPGSSYQLRGSAGAHSQLSSA